MNQKPIFRKYLTIAVSMMSMLIPALSIISIQTKHLSNEGPQSKNSILAITCQSSINTNIAFGTCTAIIKAKMPTSNCVGGLDSVKYYISLNGMPITDTIPHTPPPGDSLLIGSFKPGNYSIRWILFDCGGTDYCSQAMNIFDNTAPILNCPNPINLCHISFYVPYTDINQFLGAGGIATDPCGINNSTFKHDSTYIVLNSNPVQYCASYSVRDSNNNLATCTHKVIIEPDMIEPNITCPAHITVNVNAGLCGAVNVSLGIPTGITDNCGIRDTVARFNGDTVKSNTLIPVGTNPIIWTVTDLNGNTKTCTQNVTVVDTMAPSITCPSSITISNDPTQCYATDVPSKIGIPVPSDNCPLNSTSIPRYNNDTLRSTSQLPVGVHMIEWRITDNNGNTNSCLQLVTVQDTSKPVITCPVPRNLPLDNNCNLKVPDLRAFVTYNDNCTAPVITQFPKQDSVIFSRHDSVHTFIFTATDQAGNSTSCSVNMTAKDSLGPDIVCNSKRIISLSIDPKVSAQSFIIQAADSCGGALTYQIRRMSSTIFQDSVTFTCTDVNDTILVVVRVTDARGNFTECMDTAIIRDLIAPLIHDSLPDITISCEYPLDINNLSAFGTYVVDGSPRQNIIVNDTFYRPSNIAGMDGTYIDNCPGVILTTSVFNNLNQMCKTGEIYRTFTLKDSSNNTVIDTQKIFVVAVTKFKVSDITWPAASVDFFNCSATVPDTAITGAPRFNNINCSNVAAFMLDNPIIHPSYCKVIERKWTVIDWCQYVLNTPGSPGKWEFTQFINIKDTIAPIINTNVCRDTVICTPLTNCSASVSFSASATDDCTLPIDIKWVYKIDLNNNGGSPDITGNTGNFTHMVPIGLHKLTWEARDICGNLKTCSLLFTIKDCKSPNAVAIHGLATNLMPVMKMATMKASDFNNFSSDNCTPTNQLKYSFSADTNDVIRTFTCDSLGVRRIEMWVTDKAGNQSKAITFVDVQDNQGACGALLKVNISGKIYTENKMFIPDTRVTIDGGETEGQIMTDKSGKFSFSNLAMYNNYEVVPQKNTGHLDGITTLDIILIQRHILGIETLNSPYKLIAADVNNSKSITAADLIELRKLILGSKLEFDNNTSWRFVASSYLFPDDKNPWPFTESLYYNSVAANMNQSDFIAVKTGDLNGSVIVNLGNKTENRSNEKTNIIIENQAVSSGESIALPIYVDKNENIVGLQWTMELLPGLEYVGYEGEALHISDQHISYLEKNGKKYLTISYDQMTETNTKDKTLLFNLIFTARKSDNLSNLISFGSSITPALAISGDYTERDIIFNFRDKDINLDDFVLQNQPNPFRGETSINIGLSRASRVDISIYDAKGSAIYQANEYRAAGNQVIHINEKQLGNQFGVFYCKIKHDDNQQVVKMLRIE